MRTDLFPPIEPYRTGLLPVDRHHTLYWEECGRRAGVPVVFLHGGPGGGITPAYRRFFDPDFYRIVLFDQRGCGKSTPHADLTDNTTGHLVEDIEALRRHLGIDRWLVFGGSWGATLALAYAQSVPERCLGLVLRGVFLGRAAELDWFLTGMRHFFPEAYRDFIAALPPEERGTVLEAFHRRLTDPDPAVHLPAARAWSRYESSCSTLLPMEASGGHPTREDDAAALAVARIEAHYFHHRMFLREGQLLADLPRIRHLPATIVQGRYDIVCPPTSADDLARAWPEATHIIIPDAGHAALEPGTRAALVAATERFKLDFALKAPV